MSKYIDSDKLIAEIDSMLSACTKQTHTGVFNTCTHIKGLITSLQQDQPERLHFTPLNRLIQKIPFKNWNDTVNNYAKKLRDCLIKEGYLKDAKVLQDYISYMNGNNVPMATMDEAAKSCLKEALQKFYDTIGKPYALVNESEVDEFGEFLFGAGAEWMAGQGWIDDGSMPPETKQEDDTLQGHREWTESKPVLAWDSMYGCRIDWTRNGKWMSEQKGGYTGQVCHRIIAWRPIPEYKERQ